MSRSIDAILNKIEQTRGLTPDGREWLINALDPFHDQDLHLAGFPDLINAGTITQLVKKQFQITVPTTGPGAVGSGANWDCSIVLFPWSTWQTALQVGHFNSGTSEWTADTPYTDFAHGGLCVAAGPQGALLWPSDGPPIATYSGIDCSEFCQGNSRVIGYAMEVVNTTAAINLQGQVTVWRMPNVMTPYNFSYPIPSTSPSVAVTGTALLTRLPPGTIDTAMLLKGTKSWAASEGAYVVSRMNGTDQPLRQATSMQIVCSDTDVQPAATSFSQSTFSHTLVTSPGPATLISNFDISGAHFTGLSNATTLTVNVRWIIERMPSPDESSLVVLATESAQYDTVALEMYTRCLKDMPAGCMLKENPLGEWFRKAISAAADFLPTVGAALNTVIPGAASVGSALGTLARAGVALTTRSQPAPQRNQPTIAATPGSASTTTIQSLPRPSTGPLRSLGIRIRKKNKRPKSKKSG